MKYPKRSQYKHAKQKKYHVSNWAEYNEGLRRRGDLTVWFDEEAIANWKADKSGKPGGQRVYSEMAIETVSLIIIDPAGMVPLVALRRRKKPESARGGTCRDHAINGPRSWTTQSRWTPAIDAQRLNWLRRRRAIRSGGGAHPLAATRRTFSCRLCEARRTARDARPNLADLLAKFSRSVISKKDRSIDSIYFRGAYG